MGQVTPGRVWATYGLLGLALEKWSPLSPILRRTARVDHPVGRVLFAAGVVYGAGWLIPHITTPPDVRGSSDG